MWRLNSMLRFSKRIDQMALEDNPDKKIVYDGIRH